MTALPSLRQLRYLVTLADVPNFTRAAAACHVTQSTLSAGLKELERTLGARLVERDRQRVMLTPLGLEVCARARALLAGAADLGALARRGAAPMCGTLHLGVIPTIAPFVLPRLLPGLRAAYPQLVLALREDRTGALLERLADGRLDFALVALPWDTGNFLVREVHRDELLLVCRSGEDAALPRGLTLTARLGERLLLLEEGHCLRQHTLQACSRRRGATAAAADATLEATSLLTLVQMVESGLGLALVPELAVRAGLLAGTSLVSRRLAAPAPRRGIALLARASTARAAEFARLAEHIGTACADAPATGTQPRRRAPSGS